jgi:3-hydroxyisobutyrate dehydrogenase-like beta-hydroxyacid dehydrogenase
MAKANDPETIAVIGLGNMGSALAQALLTAGYPLTVWNRTVSKSRVLVEQGAMLANSATEAAQDAASTIVCVSEHESFVSVIHNDAVAKALQGKLLVQLGVVTAEQGRETGSWAQAQGINYLEGSILGMPNNIINATATLVCSGPKTVFDAYSDILSTFGNSHLVSETTGHAYDFDKVYYCYVYASLQGFFQGAAMAQASGFSIEAYTRIAIERLPSVKENLGRFGNMLARRDHEGDQASLEVWGDAYAKSLDLCRALNVDDTLPAALMHNFEQAISAGYGDKELSAIFEVLLPKSG